jgi:hypothetical protein
MRFTHDDLFTEPAPPGRYLATVQAARQATSRKGNLMVFVRLELTSLARTVNDYFVTDGQLHVAALGRKRLVALCRACGFEPQPNEDFELNQLRRRPVDVDIIVEPGEPMPRNRVVRYCLPANDN